MIEGDTARQNAMLKNQQMVNSQREMQMREQKFGQDEAEYQYLVKERDRVTASMAQLNKYIQDNGGVPGPDGYRMMIDTRNPQMVQMGLSGLQMLDDDRKITEFLNRTRPNSTPSQPMQPAQPMQSQPGGQGRVSLLPQPENFSPRPQLPQPNALAPSMDAGAAPTNALTPRSARSGYTQDDLIELASMRDPRAQNIVRLLSDSKSLGSDYNQTFDRWKASPEGPEKDRYAARLKVLETQREGPLQIIQGSGPQPQVVGRDPRTGQPTATPIGVGVPEKPPKLSETDKQYEAYIRQRESQQLPALSRDEWVRDTDRQKVQDRENIKIQGQLDKELPKATKAVNYHDANVDKEILLINQLLADPSAIKQITGGFAGNIDASYPFGSSGRVALARMKTLAGSGILNGITDLKNNGGTLGQVSNQENKTLSVARTTATNRTQDGKDVIAALEQYKAELEGSKKRVRDSFNETYSYRRPKAQGGGVTDDAFPGFTGR